MGARVSSRAVCAWLALLGPACGDVHADAIVLERSLDAGSGGADGSSGSGGLVPDAGSPDATSGSLPLCAPCNRGRDCGGSDDACLINPDGEQFCGRDCFSEDGCPAGFECRLISGNDAPVQCVPLSESCLDLGSTANAPSTAALRAHNLARLNAVRADRGLPSLVLDDCLNRLAQASVHERVQSGSSKFSRECAGEVPACECGWAAENTGRHANDEMDSAEKISDWIGDALRDAPNGDFAGNLLSERYSRVGVGLVRDRDALYLSNSFAP